MRNKRVRPDTYSLAQLADHFGITPMQARRLTPRQVRLIYGYPRDKDGKLVVPTPDEKDDPRYQMPTTMEQELDQIKELQLTQPALYESLAAQIRERWKNGTRQPSSPAGNPG